MKWYNNFMFDKSCRNILIRGVNWIGDGIMTLPALRAVRKSLPEANISLLVKPWVSPLFEHNPDIDEIILYGNEYNRIFGKLKLSWNLHKKKFCGAILLQNAFDAAFITFLAGIRERSGYKRDGRGFMLTKGVPVPKNDVKIHHVRYYLNLLEQIGITADYSVPYLYLPLHERLHARETLHTMRHPLLGINPGATYGSAKRWIPERFAEIANWFLKDTGGSVIIFGSKNEMDITHEIELHIRKQNQDISSATPPLRNEGQEKEILNVAGETSLRELIAFISECDAFVTNDSGPMHIAYALRTPLVALFGSTDPLLTGPPLVADEKGTVVLTPDIPCSPCFERTCTRNDMRCMYEITSDEVYFGIKKVLPEHPAVFFDRDGTLCRDVGYLSKLDDLEVFEGIHSVHLLEEKGFKLIGVTNQSGIARGLIDENFVKDINNRFIKQYGLHDFYYCPHHPDYHCSCRKPEPEMLLRARIEHGIDLKKSYVVGDKEEDMILSKMVGAKGILVQTGKDQESQHADYIAKNLKEAVNWILEIVETSRHL
jgi:heptosyltransferase-2